MPTAAWHAPPPGWNIRATHHLAPSVIPRPDRMTPEHEPSA